MHDFGAYSGQDIEGTFSRRRRSEADMEVLLGSKCIEARTKEDFTRLRSAHRKSMDEHRVSAIRVSHVADGLIILRIADLNTSRHPT